MSRTGVPNWNLMASQNFCLHIQGPKLICFYKFKGIFCQREKKNKYNLGFCRPDQKLPKATFGRWYQLFILKIWLFYKNIHEINWNFWPTKMPFCHFLHSKPSNFCHFPHSKLSNFWHSWPIFVMFILKYNLIFYTSGFLVINTGFCILLIGSFVFNM